MTLYNVQIVSRFQYRIVATCQTCVPRGRHVLWRRRRFYTARGLAHATQLDATIEVTNFYRWNEINLFQCPPIPQTLPKSRTPTWPQRILLRAKAYLRNADAVRRAAGAPVQRHHYGAQLQLGLFLRMASISLNVPFVTTVDIWTGRCPPAISSITTR